MNNELFAGLYAIDAEPKLNVGNCNWKVVRFDPASMPSGTRNDPAYVRFAACTSGAVVGSPSGGGGGGGGSLTVTLTGADAVLAPELSVATAMITDWPAPGTVQLVP